jgi:hypothetical protein
VGRHTVSPMTYDQQQWVDKALADAPPMTEEQAARISALLMTGVAKTPATSAA